MAKLSRVLAAAALVTLGTAGCSSASDGAGHTTLSTQTSARIPAAIHAACTARQLGAAFGGSRQPGTGGTGLAFVTLWDKSSVACTLAGPIVIAGLDGHGHRETASARFVAAPGSPPLRPAAHGQGQGGRMPAGGWSASFLLIASGAHPRNPSPSCRAQLAEPVTWRVTLVSGRVLTTRNASAEKGPALSRTGGLMTCQGRLGGQSPVTVTRG